MANTQVNSLQAQVNEQGNAIKQILSLLQNNNNQQTANNQKVDGRTKEGRAQKANNTQNTTPARSWDQATANILAQIADNGNVGEYTNGRGNVTGYAFTRGGRTCFVPF